MSKKLVCYKTESTKGFYKQQAYNWQTNVDSLFKFAQSAIFNKAIEKISDMTANDVILDVGCGLGEFITYFKKGRYIGIDISKKNILRAKKRFPKKTFLVMDAIKTEFPDNTFDYIVCIETIEHLTIKELDKLLCEIKRIGSNRCKIVITTPNLYYLWAVLPWSFLPVKRRLTLGKFFKGIRHGFVNENYNLPTHHYRFSPLFLKSVLEKHFTVESIDSTYWYNNRAIHGIWPSFQMSILKFSARHKFLGLNVGSQLVIEMHNNKK